jgi:heme/copper-type cytochrome/quinol oxidase subunit 1
MTVTEIDTATSEATVTTPTAPVIPAQLGGLAGVLGSGDHKTIGRLFIFTSFLFLLVSGVAGGLLGLERTDTATLDILNTDTALQVFNLHAVTGTFLFLIPLLLGIAIYVVPLQVGAATVAFPRAAAASFWTYLVSGGIVLAAYAADGGPFGRDPDAVALFVAAMVAVLAALTLAAVCVGTTGLALRTDGMTLRRAPLFTWANVAASAIWVLSLPVLAGVLILVYIDLRYGTSGFLGGADGVHRRLAWFWSQPTIFAVAIPTLGIIGDIVATAARTRFSKHGIAIGAIGGFATLSFGVWVMPGFSPDGLTGTLPYVSEAPFQIYSFAILLPVLVLAGLVADTLRRGAVQVTAGLIWSIASLLMLLAGIGNGALVSIGSLDLTGTTAQVAQSHYVSLAATLAAFGALSHWSAKFWGRIVPEGASKVLALGGLAGTVALALPDLITGFLDQRTFGGGVPATDIDAIEALNAVSAAGGVLLVLVAVGFLALLVKSATSGEPAGDDPWGGNTLEWATASPPPPGNFVTIPAITSEAPVYDARHASEASA